MLCNKRQLSVVLRGLVFPVVSIVLTLAYCLNDIEKKNVDVLFHCYSTSKILISSDISESCYLNTPPPPPPPPPFPRFSPPTILTLAPPPFSTRSCWSGAPSH